MAIRTRKLANGKSVYDVTVKHGGKREYLTLHSLAEARAAEIELKARYSQPDARRAPVTLQEYISSVYWPIASQRLSATSRDTYEKELRLRILPSLGDMRLRDIDRLSIQKMVDCCKTLSVAKISLAVLKAILSEAVEDGYIQHNYARSRFAMPPEGQRRDNGLVLATFEEIHALLDLVDSRGSECLRRVAYTGLLQGLRPEERYALDWDCFDLGEGTLTIKGARVTASRKNGGVHDKAPKTATSKRVLPLHPRLRAMVDGLGESGAFIKSSDGGKISPSTAQNGWKRFLRDNPQCPPVTIENMRHSFATAYLAAGGRIEVLSRMLGHSSINTTISRYYRPDLAVMESDASSVWAYGRMG